MKNYKTKSLTAVLLAAAIVCGCGGAAADAPGGQKNVQGGEPEEAAGQVRGDTKAQETQGMQEAQGTQKTQEEQEEAVYVQPEMKGEITASCFILDEFLEAAAEQFMKTYPDVKVTIHEYDESTGAGAVEDYRAYLNTKIMTGKAEDILFTGFLPITKYSEMGVFEDLSGMVRKMPEMNAENYFMNVLTAAKEESGELYILPYMARFDTLALSAELMEQYGSGKKEDIRKNGGYSFREAMDTAKQMVDETDKNNAFLIQMNAVSYADYLIKDSIEQFIDVEGKKADLDTPEYIALLKSVKALEEDGYFDSGIDFYNMEYYFAAACDYDVQAAYYSMGAGSGTACCAPLADSRGRVCIKANPCAAINSASENKALAWEFIRYLLSEEAQTLPSMHGPSVNRKGLAAAAERYYKFYQDGGSAKVSGGAAEYLKILENWMEQINGCDTLDSAIMDFVDEENNKYFSGGQTVEETAKRLQRQVEQYFNE